MKKLLYIALGLAALTALALDNTIINDFWNTTGYVNYAPSEREAANRCDIDASVKAVVAVANTERFSTIAPGTRITVR